VKVKNNVQMPYPLIKFLIPTREEYQIPAHQKYLAMKFLMHFRGGDEMGTYQFD